MNYSLVSRPSNHPVLDCLQYAKTASNQNWTVGRPVNKARSEEMQSYTCQKKGSGTPVNANTVTFTGRRVRQAKVDLLFCINAPASFETCCLPNNDTPTYDRGALDLPNVKRVC